MQEDETAKIIRGICASGNKQHEAPKKADAFAKLVQCLDDRISLFGRVICEAKDDGERALEVLRRHYQGKGKPRVIALYT